jgi:hypothetical protein
MPRKFSERSYQYIQGWLKDKYKTDPDFKRKADANTSFFRLRDKVRKLVETTTMNSLIDLYTKKNMNPIIMEMW